MKLSRLSLIIAVLVAATSIAATAQTRIIEYPSYNRMLPDNLRDKSKHPNTLRITSVELDSLETRVAIRIEFNQKSKPKQYGCFYSDTRLIYQQDWQRVFLPVTGISGANLHDPAAFDKIPDIEYDSDTVYDIVLTFPAIPEDVEKIDVISVYQFMHRFTDIDLTKSNAPEEAVIKRVNPHEVMKSPAFQTGSVNSLSEYVNQYLIYPSYERQEGIEGKVVFGITINENNSVTLRVLECDSPGFEYSALNALAHCKGAFKAARLYGMPVKTYFTFPVIFKLR